MSRVATEEHRERIAPEDYLVVENVTVAPERAEMQARLAEQQVAWLVASLAAARDRLRDATASIQTELSVVRQELRERTEQAQLPERSADLEAELLAARQELVQGRERLRRAEARAIEVEAALAARDAELESTPSTKSGVKS